jgi:hypothetical protein
MESRYRQRFFHMLNRYNLRSELTVAEMGVSRRVSVSRFTHFSDS